jgi:hypothetical protein
MDTQADIEIRVTLRRPFKDDKEAENLAAAIERAVRGLDGLPGLMSRLDSAFPGVIECQVTDFTEVS